MEEQYKILCSILNTRYVAKYKETPGELRPIEIDGFQSICDDKMFKVHAVCFCDIPVLGLGIHMTKYGTVGLSFAKPFLVSKGASPVFYVAKNALTEVDYDEDGKPRQEITRGQLFDSSIFTFTKLHVERKLWVWEQRQVEADVADHLSALSIPSWFLHYYVFGQVKCFDSTLAPGHRDNFYMEREWRIPGDLKFSDGDVTRVILPRDYVDRFRTAVPHYKGPITPAETIEASGA